MLIYAGTTFPLIVFLESHATNLRVGYIVDEEVEKRELMHTIVKNGHRYSHCEKQHGGSLTN